MNDKNVTSILYGTRHKTAKEKDAARKCWDCGHMKRQHDSKKKLCLSTYTCPCRRFRSRPAAKRRSIGKYASSAELRVAKLLGGERVGKTGKQTEDVRVRKAGELVAIVEVKHGPWKALFAAYDQVRAVPKQGSPRRLVAIVEKPGPFTPSRILICEEGGNWVGYNGVGDAEEP